MRKLTLAVSLLALLTVTPAAVANGTRGSAPLLVPETDGRLRTSLDHHLSFQLPPSRWAAATNDQGEPVSGAYVESQKPTDRSAC